MKGRLLLAFLIFPIALSVGAPSSYAQRVSPKALEMPFKYLSEIPFLRNIIPAPRPARPPYLPPPVYRPNPRERESPGTRPDPDFRTRFDLSGNLDLRMKRLFPPYEPIFPVNRLLEETTVQPEVGTAEIKKYQRILWSIGYDARVTGRLDKRTKDAIRQFQKDNGYCTGEERISNASTPPWLFAALWCSKGYAEGNLDEFTKSHLNLFYDLAQAAKALQAMSEPERQSYIDRSRIIRGYSVTEDTVDVYYQPAQARPLLSAINLPHLGEPDFNLIRYSQKTRRILVVDDVRNAAIQFYDYCQRWVVSHSSLDVRFIAARKRDAGYDLVTPQKRMTITLKDLIRIRSGKPLDPNHPLSQEIAAFSGSLAFLTTPFMKKSHGELQEVEELAFLLQRAYPNARIRRARSEGDRVQRRVAALSKFAIENPEDLVVVIDGKSLVRDFNIIDDIRHRLEEAKVEVVEYVPGRQWAGRDGRAVIVITGHINKALEKFVRDLCKDGYFANNFVALNSCYGVISTRIITLLLERCGAAGVLRYRGRINAHKVQAHTMEIVDRIRQRKPVDLEFFVKEKSAPSPGIWVSDDRKVRSDGGS